VFNASNGAGDANCGARLGGPLTINYCQERRQVSAMLQQAMYMADTKQGEAGNFIDTMAWKTR
jgi:hypothetical protein